MINNNSYMNKYQQQLQQAQLQQQQAQYQQQQQMLPQVPQQPQRPIITDDMIKVVMQTEEGKNNYQNWLIKRDAELTFISRQTPDGAIAHNEYENNISHIYNNILLKMAQNNTPSTESEDLKTQLADMQKQMNQLMEATRTNISLKDEVRVEPHKETYPITNHKKKEKESV